MISLAMIVKDEEDTIGDILYMAGKVCDELVVVDTGSTDRTVEIATLAGAKVEHFDWCNDFAKARNYAIEQTTNEWVMWIDGGDIFPQETVDGIRKLDFSEHDGVMMDYQMLSNDGGILLTYPRERIFQRDKRWAGKAHECIALSNPLQTNLLIQTTPSDHVVRPSKVILEAEYELGGKLPRDLFYLARERMWHGEYQGALDIYKEWFPMKPCIWEAYTGMLDAAVCAEKVDQSPVPFRLGAVALLPNRAEAWAALGDAHYAKGEWAQAVMYFSAACRAIKPKEGFIVDQWYGWLPWDRLATSLGWLGQYEEAKGITEDVLIPQCPENERLLNNLEFYKERL